MADRGRQDLPPGPVAKRHRGTPADNARLGTVIAGSYRIDDFLGRGAIGAVFGGMHLRLERQVAVKFVDPTLMEDPEIRARFKREAKIAAQIGSSHAVEVFDYGVGEDGAPYLVMEKLIGEDLHARLTREGPLSVDRALRIAKQVCRALGAAHGNGIVHRDLKPENVFLVERDGQTEFVKVVDFGLSTFVQSDDTRLTRAGQSVGTPLYMAPEQAGAHQFDARVDVYSLGVLIFETTTGRLPFEATTLQALLVALATQAPRSIRHYNPSLPIELDDLVLRFIARDPRVRPKTAAAALAEIVALEERLRAKGISTTEVTSPTRTPSGKRRELAIDGLPGKLSNEFAEELNSHLAELRRTGRLATSEVAIEDAPETTRQPVGPTEPPPPISSEPAVSSAPSDATRPMDREEILDMLSDPALPIAPAITQTSTRPPPARTPSVPPRESQKQRRAASEDDEIEEDSQVFYGRVAKGSSPRPIEINSLADPTARPSLAPVSLLTPRGGPPFAVILLAVMFFSVIAVLVLLKMMKVM